MINSYFEFFSVFLALVTSFLTIRQNALRWPVDIFIILINLYLHHKVHLYDRWILSTFIIINNFYGWYNWIFGGQNKTILKVSKMHLGTMILYVFVGIIFAFILILFLNFINSDFIYLSAFRLSFSVIAMWMASKKKLENWVFWFFLNLIGIYIYYKKGLFFYSIKYFIYMILSVYGYSAWRKSYMNKSLNS